MSDRGSELLFRMLPGPVSSTQSERHYGCFMFTCRVPFKRLMSAPLSQLRTCYPLAACSDLVNEFISLAHSCHTQTHSLFLSAESERRARASCQLRLRRKQVYNVKDRNFTSCQETRRNIKLFLDFEVSSDGHGSANQRLTADSIFHLAD